MVLRALAAAHIAIGLLLMPLTLAGGVLAALLHHAGIARTCVQTGIKRG